MAGGPFAGWSVNALGNLKKSLSPHDYSQFVADRHITHIVNNLPSSTGQAPFKYDYDPMDYGQPAAISAGQGGADASSGGVGNTGLLADPAPHIDAYLESIVRPLPPDHDRKMGQAFQEYLAQRGYYDDPYARMALLSGKEPPPKTWSPDLGLDARASGDGGQGNPAEKGTLYADAGGKTMSDVTGATKYPSNNGQVLTPGDFDFYNQLPYIVEPGKHYKMVDQATKDLIDYWARYHSIPDDYRPLLYRMAYVESSNGTNVANDKYRGLLQVGQSAADDVKLGDLDRDNLSNNIRTGLYYFAKQMDNFNGNIPQALAAYTDGPGKVRNTINKGDRINANMVEYLGRYIGSFDPNWKWNNGARDYNELWKHPVDKH